MHYGLNFTLEGFGTLHISLERNTPYDAFDSKVISLKGCHLHKFIFVTQILFAIIIAVHIAYKLPLAIGSKFYKKKVMRKILQIQLHCIQLKLNI